MCVPRSSQPTTFCIKLRVSPKRQVGLFRGKIRRMNVTICLALLCVSFTLDGVRTADIILCQKACSTPQNETSEGTQLLKHLCGCVGNSTFDPFAFLDKTTSTSPTRARTTMKVTMASLPSTQPPTTMPTTISVRVKQPATTTTTTTTTSPPVTSICDYLCSHQMGGDACRCSNPSLPGR